MIIMQKRIFSIIVLVALVMSFVPSAMADSKVAVVANSIDIEMNPGLIALLKENNLTVDYFGAKDSGYDTYDHIIILGGPDSSEHTGEISKKLLKEADQENLRNRKYRLLYETSDFFRQDQKIFVLAGSDRDYTKAAVDMYAAQIVSKIKSQYTESNDSIISTTGKNISAAELKQMIASGEDIYLIDTRTASEYASGHLKGAVNIPSDRLSTKISQIPTDRKVILYCESGTRSVSSATYLRGKGFDNVYAVTDPYSSLK